MDKFMMRRMIATLLSYFNSTKEKDRALFHIYLTGLMDTKETYNIVDYLKLAADVLIEKDAIFLIDYIAQHDYQAAQQLDVLTLQERFISDVYELQKSSQTFLNIERKGADHMKQEITASAINVLQELFYSKEHKNHFLAMKTLEMYMDLNLFQDLELVTKEIEKQNAFGLLAPMKLYDLIAVEQIEQRLRGL